MPPTTTAAPPQHRPAPRFDHVKVIELRLQRGLLQRQLAERVGISRSFMNDIEKGRRSGSPATRVAIAEALNVPTTDLYVEQVDK